MPAAAKAQQRSPSPIQVSKASGSEQSSHSARSPSTGVVFATRGGKIQQHGGLSGNEVNPSMQRWLQEAEEEPYHVNRGDVGAKARDTSGSRGSGGR